VATETGVATTTGASTETGVAIENRSYDLEQEQRLMLQLSKKKASEI
jgi:hypothetical protein